jgi:hypothetical protein
LLRNLDRTVGLPEGANVGLGSGEESLWSEYSGAEATWSSAPASGIKISIFFYLLRYRVRVGNFLLYL